MHACRLVATDAELLKPFDKQCGSRNVYLLTQTAIAVHESRALVNIVG